MNVFSKQYRQATEELTGWLVDNPDIASQQPGFFQRLHELLAAGYRASSQEKATAIAKTIVHMSVDSGPQATLEDGFLPSLDLICRAIEKIEKRARR